VAFKHIASRISLLQISTQVTRSNTTQLEDNTDIFEYNVAVRVGFVYHRRTLDI